MKKIIAFILAVALALSDGAVYSKTKTETCEMEPPSITKHPYGEAISEDGTAYFIANADNYEKIRWYIIMPDGSARYEAKAAMDQFYGLEVYGENSTQLELTHCPLTLDGCFIEATFIGAGGEATTKRCLINVSLYSEPIWADPSEGYFANANQDIQLNAGPEDLIYYELTTANGKQTGTIKSGEYVTIPAIPDSCYDAYLYAYVVGNSTNNMIFHYTMDCSAAPTEEETTEPARFGVGSYRDGSGNTIKVDASGWSEVSIVGLGWFGGYGSCSADAVYLSFTDPDGGEISAVLYSSGESYTLSISSSAWENLSAGTEFYGFEKIG